MMKPISRFDTIAQMRSQIKLWRGQGLSIGLVPTMGNLHRGHIALIETALGSADRVITTIFPNPTQFGEGEDFAAYPRSEQRDIDQITQIGGHGVFIPPVAEVYPPDFATKISVEGLGDCLCGANRPHHFGGVALIVAKLLNQARPDIVVFGQKDWQQLLIIRRLVRDLDLDVQVVSVPTVRDKAGLALSSRNGYLSAEQLDVARQFNGVLRGVALAIIGGVAPVVACDKAKADLLGLGFDKVDYLECRDGESLVFLDGLDGQSTARVFGAVYLAGARLIDNIAVNCE